MTITVTRQFFSLEEIKEAIAELLDDLNTRPFKKLEGCRRSAFDAAPAGDTSPSIGSCSRSRSARTSMPRLRGRAPWRFRRAPGCSLRERAHPGGAALDGAAAPATDGARLRPLRPWKAPGDSAFAGPSIPWRRATTSLCPSPYRRP